MLNRLIVFGKAQLSAMIGGVVDYLLMIFFTEVFGMHYTISIAIGGVVGAVVNFTLNRTWSFRSKDLKYKSSTRVQLVKFILVVLNSILMKSLGTYLITSFLKVDYKISRIMVDLFVSLAFNYTLQRFWVFKKKPIETI